MFILFCYNLGELKMSKSYVFIAIASSSIYNQIMLPWMHGSKMRTALLQQASLIDVQHRSVLVHFRLVTISRFGARQQHSRGHLAGPSRVTAVAGRWDTLLTWPPNTRTYTFHVASKSACPPFFCLNNFLSSRPNKLWMSSRRRTVRASYMVWFHQSAATTLWAYASAGQVVHVLYIVGHIASMHVNVPRAGVHLCANAALYQVTHAQRRI